MRSSETGTEGSSSGSVGGAVGGRGGARRSAVGALAAVVIIAVLAVVIFATHSAGASVAKNPEQPTATLTLAQQQVLFVHAAPWGTLTIDGQQASDTGATLERGRSVLKYVAPPFPTLTCIISAPMSLGDTCPEGSIPPTSPFRGRVIDLGATLDRLAPTDLDALVAATQRALDAATSTTKVGVGDHYINASGQVALAEQSFSATLSFVVPTASVNYEGNRCNPLCVGPGPQPLVGSGLHFIVFPTPQWSFTGPDGSTWRVSTKPINGNPIDMLVLWDGSWQVSLISTLVIGSTIEEVALANLPPMNNDGGSGTGGGATATPAAAGSVLPIFGSGTAKGLVLYHFGVLVAADAGARQMFPTMTVATAHEAAFAAQLMAHA